VSSETTKLELVAAAERLLAERGIDGPSLSEITRAAGQRNTSALQYHFGDRDELVRAILAKHETEVDRRRHALLDNYDLTSDDNLRALAGALALPFVAMFADDGGPEYLQVMGEIVARPLRFAKVLLPATAGESMYRWGRMVEPLLPEGSVGPPLHRRFAAIRFLHGELASRARERATGDHRLFMNHLIDLLTSLLGAPLTPATLELIRPRPKASAS
jgi:AcrR family transcriptional regulator